MTGLEKTANPKKQPFP